MSMDYGLMHGGYLMRLEVLYQLELAVIAVIFI